MTSDNVEYLKRAAFIVTGIIIGVVVTIIYFPTKYQDKTAEEWNTAYTKAQGQLDANAKASQSPDPLEGLMSCLTDLNKYTDYYRGTGYYVNDVSDVAQCIDDARQQEYDNHTQMLEQQQMYSP